MAFPGASTFAQNNLPLLLLGALGGYLLVLFTNPARDCLADGWRAIGRYRTLWVILGVFGFCNALFQLAQRVYFHAVLPPSTRPVFVWAREAWRDPKHWLSGTPESLWHLPRADFVDAARQSALPALESVAGIFNNLVTTFPISALAAVLLLINWNGHHAVLIAALRKRFGHLGFAVHFCILLCALAAIAKPFIYVPQLLRLFSSDPQAQWLWYLWAPVAVWLSFVFEYLFGVFIQIYLILLAYVWVRGLSFTHQHLRDFAIRRFSYVVKWAGIVLLLSTLFIDGPLILKNFPFFSDWFPVEEAVFSARLKIAHAALAAFLLLSAGLQITLTFHSESWRKAMRDHLRFVRLHAWPFAWYLILAGLHFFGLHLLDNSVRRAVGEGTALWVAWLLFFPWPAGIVGAWLLAGWVCLFKRCENGRLLTENWIKI